MPTTTPAIAVAVATIEALSELVFGLWDTQAKRWNVKGVVSILIGVIIAVLIPAFNLYSTVGIEVFPPIAGRILTGILASRGANWFHDFLRLMQAWKDSTKNAANIPANPTQP